MRDLSCPALKRLITGIPVAVTMSERYGYLFVHIIDDILDDNRDSVSVAVALVHLIPVVSGINDPYELYDDIFYSISVRLIVDIHIVYVSAVFIILENQINNITDSAFHVFLVVLVIVIHSNSPK